jgi:hypothetical protein
MGIAGSVGTGRSYGASLWLACGSACGVARLDSVDANTRHGVQHDSKRLERAVTDWFDRAGAGRHSPPHVLDHSFAARGVMRCRCLALCPQSRHARAHTWPQAQDCKGGCVLLRSSCISAATLNLLSSRFNGEPWENVSDVEWLRPSEGLGQSRRR